MTDNHPLSVSDLNIWFKDRDGARKTITQGLTFAVAEGRHLCLVGRSGSGKTSILRALAGIAEPQSGSVAWWGQPLRGVAQDDIRARRRARVGYVDQSSSLVPDLSVIENVLLPVLPDGRSAVHQHRRRATDLLNSLGLRALSSELPRTLSGGERQRVALIRALMNNPGLIIVDEPTASLDREWAERVIGTLEAARRRGAAIVTASHDPAVVGTANHAIDVEGLRSQQTEMAAGAVMLKLGADS